MENSSFYHYKTHIRSNFPQNTDRYSIAPAKRGGRYKTICQKYAFRQFIILTQQLFNNRCYKDAIDCLIYIYINLYILLLLLWPICVSILLHEFGINTRCGPQINLKTTLYLKVYLRTVIWLIGSELETIRVTTVLLNKKWPLN